MEPRVIKGCPRDKWEEVQAIQHEPFVYIMGNGSKWAGEEEDDIDKLLEVLAKYRLDDRLGPEFYTVNVCRGVRNPDANGTRQWIDGPRLYECEGVYRFCGNFLEISHGFSIDTNHMPTIDALVTALEANRNL